MSSNFRYQPFVAVSGNLGGKVPVVDDVLSSHEQEIYPTTSLDENCIENCSNGLYAHKSFISNNFKGVISEYKGVLHCEVYDYEELPDEIMEAPLSEPFFARRMKMLSRPDGFMLYGKLGVDFLHFRIITVEPLVSGHPWDHLEVPAYEVCPLTGR